MNKLLLSAMAFFALSLNTSAQTTIFQDDFESGSSNWTLNAGGFGANDWIVNNIYTGVFFTTTPSQPGGISPANGNYLHIYNQSTGCALFGDCQAVFLAGSGGDKTATMTSGISTVGMTNVTFDFWYLCGGMAGATYGMVDYSIDGGTTWVAASPQYAGIGTWNNTSLTDVAWDNQANLKFRFHWYEGTTGNDPAFAVDQVVITATSGGGGSNAIATTNDVSPASWCEGTTESVTVNFTATGTYTAGNLFTAELSDASGSFASPTAIGSLSSSASGAQTINCTVPGSVPAGTGYRIRVLSTTPSVTGTNNGTDLVINTPPTVSLAAFTTSCVYDTPFTLTGGSPAGGAYSGPGVTANVFTPAAAGVGTHSILYTYTDGNGCSATTQQALVVDACAAINEHALVNISIYPNPTSGMLQVKGSDSYEKITVLDLSGRKVLETKRVPSDTYDLNNIPTGVYLVKVSSVNNEQTFRVIKR